VVLVDDYWGCGFSGWQIREDGAEQAFFEFEGESAHK
jgi:hypothetical protein